MSEFSQLLELYIPKSGLTENQLAKISGYTRSYIALMKNGQRVSPDTVKMKALSDALGLSPYEYDQLWNAYLKARFGERSYELSRAVVKLLHSFTFYSDMTIQGEHRNQIPDVTVINNRTDLEAFVKAVVENEAQKDGGEVCLIMQEDFSFLYNLIAMSLRSNKTLKVEHILCLEGSKNSDRIDYNLSFLSTVIPVLLSAPEGGYEAWYYYDSVKEHFTNSALMPYVVMTQDYVISISSDMTSAAVFKDRQINSLFKSLFEQRKQECRRLFRHIEGGYQFFEYYKEARKKCDFLMSMGSQPCFAVLPLENIVKKYEQVFPAELYRAFVSHLKEVREVWETSEGACSYFTKDGLEWFMRKGVIDELPKELAVTLPPQERTAILGLLIDAIRQGRYEAYLIENKSFRFPPQLSISTYQKTTVNLLYSSKKGNVCFTVDENGITGCIYNFLQHLKYGTDVLSTEETLAYLETLYRQSKQV